jgi:7,8-dihydropterin-6-yl-methyl-4-(beta-D-ribofuranosyl)aminobenzene 5'-phosphate synthase
MIIKTFAENTSISEEYKSEHGLSLYIQTRKHKLLFDLGKNDLFLENAEKMGIDIADIDLVVISHGHYDHGGSLKAFLHENSKAKIYIHKRAFEKHYSIRPNGITADIGLDDVLKENERIVFAEDYLRIDEELELFSNVKGKELCSLSNKVLLMKDGDQIVEDSFAHEQNLIITEDGKMVLVAGCAHNGIVNIVKHFIDMKGRPADYVIGGFHLFNPSANKSEDPSLVNEIGKNLMKTGSLYYTCHCTGLEAFAQLQGVMKDKIQYSATGSVVKI